VETVEGLEAVFPKGSTLLIFCVLSLAVISDVLERNVDEKTAIVILTNVQF
jgi:hypothetical protein